MRQRHVAWRKIFFLSAINALSAPLFSLEPSLFEAIGLDFAVKGPAGDSEFFGGEGFVTVRLR